MNKKQEVVALTAISGEVSPSALKMLIPSRKYRYTILEQAQSENLLRRINKNHIKAYLLTEQGKRALLQSNPERYQPFLTGNTQTNLQVSELKKRLRLHRISEVLAVLQSCKICLFRDEKDHTYTQYRSLSLNGRTFYLCKELGEISHINMKMQNSRAVGILLTQSDTFVLYNTGEYVMRWFPESEKTFRALLEVELGYHRGMEQCLVCNQRAILFGDDNALASRLLSSRGGYKRHSFSLDGSYDSFHFIPRTEKGISLFQILTTPKKRESLQQTLKDSFPEKRFGENFEYDAALDDNTAVLFAWDYDLQRLQHFCMGIFSRNLSGLIVAFDFQIEVYRNVYQERVQYKQLNWDAIMMWLL